MKIIDKDLITKNALSNCLVDEINELNSGRFFNIRLQCNISEIRSFYFLQERFKFARKKMLIGSIF